MKVSRTCLKTSSLWRHGGLSLTLFLISVPDNCVTYQFLLKPSATLRFEGLVVPGALLLFASSTWFIVAFYGGWIFLDIPWLAGMVGLFAFEFIEGNTVTRLYFLKLRRLTKDALEKGYVTPALERARREQVPTFTHFLDIPLLLVIVSLGAIRPNTWTLLVVGTGFALLTATILTIMLPRLYPWTPESAPHLM